MSIEHTFEIATDLAPADVARLLKLRCCLLLNHREPCYVLFEEGIMCWVSRPSEARRELIEEQFGLETTVSVRCNPEGTDSLKRGMKAIGEIAAVLIDEEVGDFVFLVNGESARLMCEDGEITVDAHEEWWISFWGRVLEEIDADYEVQPLPQL